TPGFGSVLNRGAISAGNVSTVLTIAGNTVRRPQWAGIAVDQQLYYYDPVDTPTMFVDSNAASASDSNAVVLDHGTLVMVRNNIRNNALDGVHFNLAVTASIHDNAFQGNGLYAVNNCADGGVDVLGNWWGVDGQTPGSPGTDSTCIAFDSSPLATQPGGLP